MSFFGSVLLRVLWKLPLKTLWGLTPSEVQPLEGIRKYPCPFHMEVLPSQPLRDVRGGLWRRLCWALTRAQKMVKLKWEALAIEWFFNFNLLECFVRFKAREIFNIWTLQAKPVNSCVSAIYILSLHWELGSYAAHNVISLYFRYHLIAGISVQCLLLLLLLQSLWT